MRIFSPKGTYLDIWLHPVGGDSGHILRGQAELSRYAALGYWAPDQITLSDAHGNERHGSQTDFGWKLYIDNPLADDEAPKYVKNSARLTLSSEGMENGRSYQVLTARWQFLEEGSGLDLVEAHVNDESPETYSRSVGNFGSFEEETGEATVDMAIPDYFPSGTYSLNHIGMRTWR